MNNNEPLTLPDALKLAIQHHQAGELQQAEYIYQQILQIDPTYSDALHFLGVIAGQVGNYPLALEQIQQSIAINNQIAMYHGNLGNTYKELGRMDEAIYSYQRALELDDAAADIYDNLGVALQKKGEFEEAIQCHQHAITLDPAHANAYYNLGIILADQYRLAEAVQCYEKAIQLNPNFTNAYNNLANCLRNQGYIAEAIAAYQQALALTPQDASIHSNLLYTLNASLTHDKAVTFQAHQQFNQQHCLALTPLTSAFKNSRDPYKKLKIGYISSDFHEHSVGYFIEAILANHNHQQFEIYCYYNQLHSDDVTQRLQNYVDHWVTCQNLDDNQFFDKIQQDQIDILVDLNGHTANNRLLVFARKSAPVQMAYLGYSNTTGLTSIDYRLSDNYADPEPQSDLFSSEKLIRLPNSYYCYTPYPKIPEINPLPASGKNYITFGSFNHKSKLNKYTLYLWAQVLQAIPTAKFLIKNRSLADENTKKALIQQFNELGITENRLILKAHTKSVFDHLSIYHDIDIGLDTFPYNGATTTCEALWMGIPVVTLVGEKHVSRMGLSILSTAGLKKCLANTEQEFIQRCVQLAQNLTDLSTLRQNLRTQLQNSPLMQASIFTQQLESVYRQCWQTWCEQTNEQSTAQNTLTVEQAFQLAAQYYQQRAFEKSEEICQQILQLNSQHADSWHLLGILAGETQNYSLAIENIKNAIQANPNSPAYYSNLGNVYWLQSQLELAIQSYQQAIQLHPNYAHAYAGLGNIYKKNGQHQTAVEYYSKAIELEHNSPETWNNLSNAYRMLGQLDEAIVCCEKALAMHPNFADAHNNLGETYKEKGWMEKALDSYRQALALNPRDISIHTNILLGMHYVPGYKAQTIFAEHRQFNEQHAKPLAHLIQAHTNLSTPDKRLKIGYLSPDLRQNVVAYFLEPILRHHNHQQFEIYCYYTDTPVDEVTQRFQQFSDQWRSCAGLQDSELASMIRQDEIDILVNLTLPGQKEFVVAHKPAPIQVTYLGYSDTTGLDVMDYRIVDHYTDPVGMGEEVNTEALIRTDGSYYCYQPETDAPLVKNLPALDNNFITFGSFHNFFKLNFDLFKLWANVLHAVPNSKLLFKTKSLRDAKTRQYFLDLFAQLNIPEDRLIFIDFTATTREHLDVYNRVDIKLDSFPYNGATTTCEALWMGVPVVTLVGETHVARMGFSILSALGLTSLVANTQDEYVNSCVKLASNLIELQALRLSLREKMQHTSILDGISYTQALEAHYRQIWQKWCKNR